MILVSKLLESDIFGGNKDVLKNALAENVDAVGGEESVSLQDIQDLAPVNWLPFITEASIRILARELGFIVDEQDMV